MRKKDMTLPSPAINFSATLQNDCEKCNDCEKMDDLRQQVGACYKFRDSGLMAFTETRFGEDVPDNLVQIEGFSHV